MRQEYLKMFTEWCIRGLNPHINLLHDIKHLYHFGLSGTLYFLRLYYKHISLAYFKYTLVIVGILYEQTMMNMFTQPYHARI